MMVEQNAAALELRGRRRLLVLLALVLGGCTARYEVSNLSEPASPKLDRGKVVYVAIPQDGAYGNRNYPGSGQMVAQSVAAAFSGLAKRVQVADRQAQQPEQAVEAAKSVGADYVAVPVIVQWEHRNTAWSGIPSRMSIRLTLLDAATGKQITSSAIEGRSRIMSWTATSPESLLKEPVHEYVRGLY